MASVEYPLFRKDDVNGFWALFQNNLANFAWLSITMVGMGFPPAIVFGRMIPGAAIAVAAGNFYYANMAKRLAIKEGRTDVTALSYGLSTPVQFIYMVIIAGGALSITRDHETAWQIAVAACVLGGLIEVLGGFIGRAVRTFLPRAAMLGALAGVALTFIAGELFFKTFAAPIVGSVVLVIIMIGLISRAAMPFKIPSALLAIVLGTVLAYLLGVSDPANVAAAAGDLGIYIPLPTLAAFQGLGLLFGEYSYLLAVIIPISVYNFVETMNNVEAVSALGDDYDVRESQFADGAGTILGALFGGILPTTVYIASVGAKEMNAGRGYSILNGGVFLVAAALGLVGAVSRIIPIEVIAPILVYVGIVMVANAFIKSPHRHAPAVALAMIPYFANYLGTRINRGEIDAFPAGAAILHDISPAIMPLTQGAMFTALLWGAITVFLIDKQYKKASAIGLTMAVMAAFGLMHAPRLQFMGGGLQNEFVIGYLIVAVFCYGFSYLKTPEVTPDRSETVSQSGQHPV